MYVCNINRHDMNLIESQQMNDYNLMLPTEILCTPLCETCQQCQTFCTKKKECELILIHPCMMDDSDNVFWFKILMLSAHCNVSVEFAIEFCCSFVCFEFWRRMTVKNSRIVDLFISLFVMKKCRLVHSTVFTFHYVEI